MKLNNLMNTLLIFLILILCIGTVSADGIIQNGDVTLDAANDGSLRADKVLAESQNNLNDGSCRDALSEEPVAKNSKDALGEEEFGSFKEIQDEINSGKYTFDLSKDYKYNSDSDKTDGISINSKYVTINAHGHIFDGDNLARIFKITGTGNLILNDAIIRNGFSQQNGGAIYSTYKLTLNNVTFINNNVKTESIYQDGGAIYLAPSSAASSMTISNCTFVNNSATGCGGAIATDYNRKSVIKISDSSFEDNWANSGHGLGGAIYATSVEVNSTSFKNNKAGNDTGSGGAISSPMISSFNSTFFNNTAVSGFLQTNFNITNSTFNQNNAGLGGGAIRVSECGFGEIVSIENSSFTSNDGGRYGGGAIISSVANVSNSNFTNNTAFNYGGAISSQKLDVKDCKFENNTAKHSAAIFSMEFSIRDSQFDGNEATDGTIITTLEDFKHEGTTIPKTRLYDYTYYPYYWDYWYDTYLNCIEQVKILYYLCNLDEDMLSGGFRTSSGKAALSVAIYDLCREDLSNPQNETVKKVMELYDSGFRVPNDSYLLDNGTRVNYEFYLFINPQYIQNYLLYEQTTEDGYNLTVSKETLNKTVEVGQEVQFRITVTNNGEQTLNGVFVNDSDFDDGLIYQSYINETGEWTFNETSKIWSLTTDLEKGDSASFIVIFETAKVGELVNNVSAGFDNYVVANSTNTTNVTDIPGPTRKIDTDNTDDTKSNGTNTNNTTNSSKTTSTNDETDTPEENNPKVDAPNEDVPKVDAPKGDNVIHKKGIVKKAYVSKTATGNPLFALVLMIVALAFVPKRKN